MNIGGGKVTDGFHCPKCKRVSHHPKDIEEGYCGHCHDWTGLDPEGDWSCGRCGGLLAKEGYHQSDRGYGEICISCAVVEATE